MDSPFLFFFGGYFSEIDDDWIVLFFFGSIDI
jgi:hypothetical protein